MASKRVKKAEEIPTVEHAQWGFLENKQRKAERLAILKDKRFTEYARRKDNNPEVMKAPDFPAPSAFLIGVQMRFRSTNDNKDFDTTVRAEFEDDQTQFAASWLPIGELPDHTYSKWCRVSLLQQPGAVKRDLLKRFFVTVIITPNGNDFWPFNAAAILRFSDGNDIYATWKGLWLSKERKVGRMSWKLPA